MAGGKNKKVLYLSVALVGLFLLAIVVVGGFGLVSVVASTPAWDPKNLESDMTTFIYDREGNTIATLHGVENRIPIAIQDIPKHVQQAFIATEDVRFYEHKGVDFKAITRAAVTNIRSNKVVEGGSTITQQLVKNSFLTPEKNFSRKINEALLSFEIEKNYTKDEILGFYLNRVYFGHGAYGVQAAAELYFGKNAEELTIAEGALLAGLVQSPNNYSPFKNEEKAEARMKRVLRLMEENQYISSFDRINAETEGFVLAERNKDKNNWDYPFFVDYVIEHIVAKYNISESQIFKGGFKIYTTLDPKIQTSVENAFSDPKNFPKGKEDQQVQGAMVIIDYKTGEIKALAGGREHEAKRGFNRATSLKRQPGSTFKPIVAFAPALDLKYPPNLLLNDSPTTFKGNYQPRNANGRFLGPITMKTAITWSVNVYSVKLLELIGVDTGYKYASKLGFKLDEKDKVLPLALGGLTHGVSPLEMAQAYGTFGNQGVMVESTPISKIEDNQGKTIVDVVPKKSKVMSSQAAYLMTDMLINAVNNGTGKAARMSRPVAGKTGTSQVPTTKEFQGIRGNKDVWFVGYTPELVAAVWMGYDVTDRKHYLDRVYGGNHPAQMWRKVMSEALKGEKITRFEKPKENFQYKKGVPTGVDGEPILTPEEKKKLEEEEKKKQEEEEKKRLEEEKRKQDEAEKKRLEEEKRKQDEAEKKRLEEEKRKKEEEEKKRLEEEKRRQEEEKKRLEEEKRRQEEEKKRQEEEKRRQEEEEKKRLEEERRRQEEANKPPKETP